MYNAPGLPPTALDARTLRITHQVQRNEGTLDRRKLKTSASKATIPLPAFAADALRRHRTRQAEERLRMGARALLSTRAASSTTCATPLQRCFTHAESRQRISR